MWRLWETCGHGHVASGMVEHSDVTHRDKLGRLALPNAEGSKGDE